MKAIFDFKRQSIYDDDITHKYQFPQRYLAVANKSVGDWIVYRQTQRGSGQMTYIALARHVANARDPSKPSHFYARVDNFIPFNRDVPFHREKGTYWESTFNEIPPDRVGRSLRGNAMRTVSDEDFGDIAFHGLGQLFDQEMAQRLYVEPFLDEAIDADLALADSIEKSRKITELVTNRPVRDANFRHIILDAYSDTCAITGLRIVNGFGRAEANAAHIRPVKENGPDIVRNGLALSATCHWLFDRHLISLTDECELLVSKNLPKRLTNLFPSQGHKILLPDNNLKRPNPLFLEHHRKQFEEKLRGGAL